MINLIRNITKYNQIQKVYVKIKIKNTRRSIQTGIFINSANHAHTHKILGLYFDSICGFFGVVSIHKLSSSKISSGSQIELTIFTNFFWVISHFTSKSFSNMLWWISSKISSEIWWDFAYLSILEMYFSKKSFAELSILKVCPWILNSAIFMKLLL